MQDLVDRLKRSWKQSTCYRCIFDLAEKEAELRDLQERSEDPVIWNDSVAAQRLMKKISELREEIEPIRSLEQRTRDAYELAELDDESLRSELEPEVDAIESDLAKRELRALLSGPYDKGNALLTINAGAGGTDSQDWAAMLERMYLRWAERRGFDVEILDRTEGEEAGIKTVTIAVNGRYAYGYLRPEKGVHRLVRLSPFDSAHRRHTSFAQVEVLPDMAEEAMTKSRSTRKICGSISIARPARVGKTCKRMPPPCASPTCPPVWLSPARMNARKCKTVKMPCACCAPACWKSSMSSKIAQWLSCAANMSKPNGAARSARMCCTPTRWSKITAPNTKWATPRPCWMVKLMGLLKLISKTQGLYLPKISSKINRAGKPPARYFILIRPLNQEFIILARRLPR